MLARILDFEAARASEMYIGGGSSLTQPCLLKKRIHRRRHTQTSHCVCSLLSILQCLWCVFVGFVVVFFLLCWLCFVCFVFVVFGLLRSLTAKTRNRATTSKRIFQRLESLSLYLAYGPINSRILVRFFFLSALYFCPDLGLTFSVGVEDFTCVRMFVHS